MLRNLMRVARKELAGFFSSPVAYIFLGVFLFVTLFVFFWADTFFARNIADVRPLFEWMPVLLIFLVAAVTMRMWSEERRMGTIEYLMTLPVSPLQYLAGKFLAALALVALALLLTLPLPMTVAAIGPLDWGPVWGGYLAAMFLAAAYIAIGLFLSTRSDNQIVSLIATVLVCGLFYLLGDSLLTNFFSNRGAELLKLFGTGSRFESIARGVVDLRDLYYYLSLVGVFFTLTLYSLERLRWDRGVVSSRHRLWGILSLLLVANFLAGNFWLQQIGSARLDLTEGKIYSISPATEHYLAQLREPLLLRGYFSAKTHPLLAPLVPRLRDLINEYQVAGNGKVRAEFVDPQQNPDLEAEANQKYGIKPVPFQVADRYQTALVNSYFQILVQYGDQYQVLDFRDLIDVKQGSQNQIDVELRNPEYELTRAIKKVMYEFRSGGDLFAGLQRPVTLNGYISADGQLPPFLQKFKQEVLSVADEMQQKASGKFKVQMHDPEADGGALAAKIETDYGFRPMQAGLLDPKRFYFYLNLDDGDQTVQVPLPEDFTKTAFKQSLDAALKRFSAGYLKTVALVVPKQVNPYMAQLGMGGDQGKQFNAMRDQLKADHNVREIDLDQGTVPEAADILVILAPGELTDKGLFAVDQFLMKGGTVMLATSPFKVTFNSNSLTATKTSNQLLKWLKHYGIGMDQRMVLDDRSQPFPVPVTRNVSGVTLQELRLVPYPYFIDLRGSGLNQKVPVTAGLDHILFNWASPITVDAKQNQGRKTTWLMKSSAEAWTSDGSNLVPRFDTYGSKGFAEGNDRGEKLLGVMIEGRFPSYFQGKESPLLQAPTKDKGAQSKQKTETAAASPQVASVIDRSPESARIILFGSSDFLSDQTLQLATSVSGQHDLGALQLVNNSIDWSLEDPGLLSIRGRGHYARTLIPLNRETQAGVESLDYGLSLVGLLLVFAGYQLARRRTRAHYRQLLEGRA